MADRQDNPYGKGKKMHNHQASEVAHEFKALVRELLGLDPASLTHMDPMRTSVVVGLHEFMRATIERAMGALWAPEGTSFRLLPETASPKALRRLGWSDAKAYNLSSLLAHAIVSNTPRRMRGLPYISLSKADANIINLPEKVGAGERVPTAGLVAAEVDIAAPGQGELQTISICEQIKERLGLSPEILVRPCYEGEREATEAVARDPEGQALNGLAALLMTVFRTYQAAISQVDIDSTAIRLLIVDDAQYTGFANARFSNISQLLLGALLAENGRDLALLVQARNS